MRETESSKNLLSLSRGGGNPTTAIITENLQLTPALTVMYFFVIDTHNDGGSRGKIHSNNWSGSS